jgi:DNA-binding GntR family transcriptional regulator
MGTSRGPIREAIRILTGTGLVTPVVNRGVFVRKVSIKEMLEIYDLRALVFGFAAERACEHVTDAERRSFEELLDGMDRAAQAGDSGLYYDLNVQFHELILVLSHSQRAHQLYDSYVKELHLYRRQNFNAPGNMRDGRTWSTAGSTRRFQRGTPPGPSSMRRSTSRRGGKGCWRWRIREPVRNS